MIKAQIIKCKCGSVFAGCAEPYCYTEKSWLKDIRKYVLDGCSVEMSETGSFRLEECTCEKVSCGNVDTNQIPLFK